MTRNLSRPLFAATLAVMILFIAPLSFACGPFSLDAIFVFTGHPEYPLQEFAQGELGPVQPTYARSYLYVAYRHLMGTGFNQREQQALTELWEERLNHGWELGEEEWIQKWMSIRAKVPGLAQPAQIDVYRHRDKPNEYETYLNCQKDAFTTAATTLETRIGKFGADSTAVRDWVEVQDQVFANCSEGRHIPAPAPAEVDLTIRADRAYQIAAAEFYAGDFEAAERLFGSIGADDQSPWQTGAPYLMARTLVRKASLGPIENKKPALSDAEKQLNMIIGDPKLAASHAAAKRLLSVVRLRLHPEARLHELAQSLIRPNQESLKQDLWDYTFLLDQFLGEDDSERKVQEPAVVHDDDLTDWIFTFQSTTGEALDHSLARWRATHSAPWLVASLTKIDAKDPRVNELLSQAARTTPNSPAYPTVLLHAVRLALDAGRVKEARSRIDEALARHRSALNSSSQNLLLNMRMMLADTLKEFLTYSQRQPAGFSWNDDGLEIPADLKEEKDSAALQGKSLFDVDAMKIFNEGMPLALLKQAAESELLPNNLHRDMAQAAWLRAVLLGDMLTADELVPALKSTIPEMGPLLDDYIAAREPEAKRFTALYAWLKFPGLEPIVDAGVGRRTPLSEQDAYRDNWWCGSAFSAQSSNEADNIKKEEKRQPFYPKVNSNFPRFLTTSQRTIAAKEFAALVAIGAAPNYLCRGVVLWATKNPDDLRVPEALHLAVKTTRYGCTDKETGRWSKSAYDLLHRRYPQSPWAKKTPYWYKD